MIKMSLFTKHNRDSDIKNKLMVSKEETGRDELVGVWD